MCCCYHSLLVAVSTLRLYFPVLRHYLEISSRTSIFHNYNFKRGGWGVGGLATVFDLAAFRLCMIAPVKKSVNHPRNVARMRETGLEQQHEFGFGPVLSLACCSQFISAVIWNLRFPFFWSCVCHYKRFTTLRTRPVNMFLDARPFDYVFIFRRLARLKGGPTLQYLCRRVCISSEKPKINSS